MLWPSNAMLPSVGALGEHQRCPFCAATGAAGSQPFPLHSCGQEERRSTSRKGPAETVQRVRLFWRQKNPNRLFLPSSQK